DDSTIPPAGSGGFGISKFFTTPSYQSSLNSMGNRSIPDVVVNADPFMGTEICEADAGGCPTGSLYGGTSVAAPMWAAFVALLNQAQGTNLGFLNPKIYPLAEAGGFHDAAALGSDFFHVGLGSPNGSALDLLLAGRSVGTPSASLSTEDLSIKTPVDGAVPNGIYDDGKTVGYVTVQLLDANGNSVGGKTVKLSHNSGSNAQITPASGVSTASNGSVTFQVTDETLENVTFTATDQTDGVTLATPQTVDFIVPPAAGASLIAGPSQVTADGKTPADITVTLQDSLGRPTPGKLIQISQTGGNSVISGPNPPLTDASGKIDFSAVDSNNETITYSAVDVTDGNLPFPATGTVSFSDAPEPGCSNTFVAAPGYIAQPYATGFTAENFCVSGVCVSGCPGAFGLAFDASGNLFAVDQPTGDIYKFPPGGGVADSSTLLTQTAIPTLDELAIDSKGNLYGGVNETGGNYMNGEVVTINQSTGAISGTVASGLTCPALISVDPLSGDLFADDNCSGAGLNNASLWRISDPSGSPSVSLYATLPGSPNGTEAFAPGGSIYITTSGGGGEIAVVSGTNGPTTPTVSTLGGFSSYGLGLIAQGSPSSSAAQFLISSFNGIDNTPGGIGTFDVTGDSVTQSATTVTNNGQAYNMIIGPDGCVYAARGVAVFRITDTSGACTYAAANPSPSLYLAPIGISPNPPQGSTQNFTATFNYKTVPDGTPVLLTVTGANPQAVQANTTGGVASFSYTGSHEGVDTLVASATVSGSPVTSNNSVVTWGAGTDVTFLTLNRSPTAGTTGQTVNLSANLTDVSATPVGALAGQEVQFSLGGANCSAATDSNGNASCQVTASGAGSVTLSASFAGTAQYNPSNASEGFNVIASLASPTPTATATPTATRTATPTATPTPVVGKLKVSPKRLDFGDVEVGSNKTKDVKVINAGKVKKKKVPLPILIEMENGVTSPFSITQACDDDDLGPKSKGVKAGSCEVGVTFAPTAAMKYSGTLMIIDNLEPTFERSVKLEGTGKEPKK
ncbi:MAG: Ig-like domain-containing protein, partial [Candidatus Binatus sp.]